METFLEELRSAIDHLGAVEVAPNIWAYYDDNVPSWLTAKAKHLLSAADQPNRRHTCLAIMPAWWTPERRYAVHFDYQTRTFATRDSAEESVWGEHATNYPVVTVNLDTGAEMKIVERGFTLDEGVSSSPILNKASGRKDLGLS